MFWGNKIQFLASRCRCVNNFHNSFAKGNSLDWVLKCEHGILIIFFAYYFDSYFAMWAQHIDNFLCILFANLHKFSWQEKLKCVKDTNLCSGSLWRINFVTNIVRNLVVVGLSDISSSYGLSRLPHFLFILMDY